ncbi:MAG: TolC family protein [Flavobacteriales bacterium]|nr:TolC family protein [Flavobacteriales bacterium]
MKNQLMLLLLGALAFSSLAQSSYTLDEAISSALKNNELVKQADIDVEISRAKVKETTAIGLPQVSGEASLNYFADIPTQVAPANVFEPSAPADILVPLQFGLPYSTSAGLTASQLIFDGSYFVGLRASKAYLNYTLLGRERTQIEVREQVSQLYFAVIALNESLESLEKNMANMEKSANDAKAMAEVGFMEQQDADQMKLAQSNLTYQIDMATRQKDNLMSLLKFQMGVPVDQEIELADSFEALLGDPTEEVALDPQFALERHIDFRTVDQGEELSKLSLANQRAKYYPQVAGFFTHSQNGFGQDFGKLFSNDFYPTTILGLQLNVPIFSSGMRYYQTKQAKLELEKTQSQKQMVMQNLQLQAMNARRDYMSASENLQLVDENLKLAERIKISTEKKYEEGVVSSLEYTQSESQYLQTLATYISTAQEVFNAKLALNKALGIQ